ncbi:PREDICTED: putative F-box/kelch-repeat protein At3g24610 [Camelina sativa]|uniref:F-box/kelch-repeat protein At3g24610 n=1 Tax=Camelina sativa TaxID=90675 RepID=A0ABM0VIB6_CAMSA|nr:PREDICTED: putative F-box/kelch-repeat protein At3g24610 [Camelina sativa]
MSKSEEPTQEQRKEEASPEACLTQDVALNCLARVSRMDLAALSVASKSYHSLVASPDLYKIRSLMDRTETYVYVCLLTPPPNPNPRWYIPRRRKTLDASDLIPIPSLPSRPPEASSVVVLDCCIYVIGGMRNGKKRTSGVWLLDCRTHRWRPVPCMGVARAYAAAQVVDGKIYVLGGCRRFDPNKWGEVFDPKTQTWDTLPPMPSMPTRKEGNKNIHDSVVRDQKVYVVDGTVRTYYYSPRQGQWGSGNRGQVKGNRRDWCMIDNLVYCLNVNGSIYWFEPDEFDLREPEGMMDTKEVKGLGSLKRTLFRSRVVHFGEHLRQQWEQDKIKHGITPQTKNPFVISLELEDLLPGARLINSGGNIMLFWDVIEGDRLEIWCAEISLERRQGGDVWGNTEWHGLVQS